MGTMTKAEILNEIRRTAPPNGGPALGMRAFERETGIRHTDWLGIHWRTWGDAVREAGLEANSFTPTMDEAHLFSKYALLTRELGRAPAQVDMRMMRRRDSTFPADAVFTRRFGSYAGLRARTLEWCSQNEEFADVVQLLVSATGVRRPTTNARAADTPIGFVYMIKHGSRAEYKIGRTVNPVRREGEMRLQLPERVNPIHYIETDDPSGVESYWHSRFASKRKEGEWFALTPDDVRAFKKWKRIS
jgi:hypothetical protein